MKSLAINILLLSLISLFLLSCSKDEINLNYSIETISSNTEASLHEVFFLNTTTGFLVAGQLGESGSIYKTIDGGQSWDLNFSTDRSLYAINFLNDSVGYAVGERLILLKTFDQGVSWEDYQFPYYPNYLYDAPFKKIDFVDDMTVYLTGGMYFDRGLIAKSANGGTWWDWDFFNFELSSAHVFKSDYAIFCGYGHFTVTMDGADSFEIMDFNGDFFTSMYFLDDEVGFASGYDGGIYKTNNSGTNWEIMASSNKLWKQRLHLNDILMVNPEKGIAAGNNGIIVITYDGGNNWQHYEIEEELDFYSIYHLGNGKLWISCSEGKMLKINI